jgi:hypothetical protein
MNFKFTCVFARHVRHWALTCDSSKRFGQFLRLFTTFRAQSCNTIYRSNRCAAISLLHRHVSRSLNKSDPSVGAIGRKRDNILERHGASQCKLRRAVSGNECHCQWLGRGKGVIGRHDRGRDGCRQGELTRIVGAQSAWRRESTDGVNEQLEACHTKMRIDSFTVRNCRFNATKKTGTL